jgi:hypothetical protein
MITQQKAPKLSKPSEPSRPSSCGVQDHGLRLQRNDNRLFEGAKNMQEYDEQPTDIEDDQSTCHDCDSYKEMIESLNQEIARLRSFVRSPAGFSSLEDARRQGIPESHREGLDGLEARLRGLTLGLLAHQRQAH